MRAWGQGALPINKMASHVSHWFSYLSLSGFTQIGIVHGNVSSPGEDDGAGKLQLWHHEKINKYGIWAGKRANIPGKSVCELFNN